ncbi:MAG: SagB/ThcOx family dehydrogenase, partial [Ktedonobacteraceae bacterium]|nr:SagB/ThcOx family dehydrogenase [Ktedonobacteraceae bacterium]
IPVPTSGRCEPSVSDTTQALTPLHRPLVNKETFQRSKRVFTFGTNKLVHEATLVTDERQPAVSEAFHARADVLPTGNEQVALPPPDLAHLQDDLLETFLQRRSSFGSFSAHIPLSRNELATLLYFGSSVSQYVTDLKQANGEPHFTRLMVFVNHTDGVEPGAYAYDREQHCLLPLHKGDLTLFLQQNYFLQNYNLAETGALIAIVGNVDGMLNVYGNRGYRILNAEVGMVAQGLYMAATALSVACGAALGFDNTTLNTMLGLDRTGHKTLLFLMAGHERQNIGNFDYRLF